LAATPKDVHSMNKLIMIIAIPFLSAYGQIKLDCEMNYSFQFYYQFEPDYAHYLNAVIFYPVILNKLDLGAELGFDVFEPFRKRNSSGSYNSRLFSSKENEIYYYTRNYNNKLKGLNFAVSFPIRFHLSNAIFELAPDYFFEYRHGRDSSSLDYYYYNPKTNKFENTHTDYENFSIQGINTRFVMSYGFGYSWKKVFILIFGQNDYVIGIKTGLRLFPLFANVDK
jgi:hypothetical protein